MHLLSERTRLSDVDLGALGRHRSGGGVDVANVDALLVGHARNRHAGNGAANVDVGAGWLKSGVLGTDQRLVSA